MHKIIPYKPHLTDKIALVLLSMDVKKVKETMRKGMLMDILGVLLVLRKQQTTQKIEEYIQLALSSDILDRKAKKEVERILA